MKSFGDDKNVGDDKNDSVLHYLISEASMPVSLKMNVVLIK